MRKLYKSTINGEYYLYDTQSYTIFRREKNVWNKFVAVKPAFTFPPYFELIGNNYHVRN